MDRTSGEIVKEIREELGYDADKLAEKFGVSYNYFYNIEVKNINPSTSIRDKLIRMYLEDANGDRERRVSVAKELLLTLADKYRKEMEAKMSKKIWRLFLEPASEIN